MFRSNIYRPDIYEAKLQQLKLARKFIETKKVKKSQTLKLSRSWANLCTKQGKFSR